MNTLNQSGQVASHPSVAPVERLDQNTNRIHLAFAAIVALSLALLWRQVVSLIQYSLNNESASHILLIPAISLYLVFIERKKIFRSTARANGSRLLSAVAGLTICAAAIGTFFQPRQGEPPWLPILCLIAIWIVGFYLCYGHVAFRAALFPLLFLLLAVPLPTAVLDRIVRWLQEGSTAITYWIFQLFGVPVFRQGFFLTVPGVTIEVAQECSGIRSSVALLITCLLAAHMYLRTGWKMALFVFLVVPWSILKNGIRIATLTLLSLYVNPGFLHGDLHRDGGVFFFLLALAGLFPVLLVLHKSETRGHTKLASQQA